MLLVARCMGSVSIMYGYELDGQVIEVRSPTEAKEFYI
jgi:hypothetical protein